MDVEVRKERSSDVDAVHALNVVAFETEAEARLVDILRETADPVISLVAEFDGVVVGHILFSPVSADSDPMARIIGLAPMAVLPDHQRKGIGSSLVREGLEACRAGGWEVVVVLGHPRYYPRFGFLESTQFGIKSEYEVPAEAFMALELRPGALGSVSGVVRYHKAFGEV